VNCYEVTWGSNYFKSIKFFKGIKCIFMRKILSYWPIRLSCISPFFIVTWYCSMIDNLHIFSITFYAPLWRKGAYCLHLSVGMSVGRPDNVRSISWESFIRLLWYFICGLVIRRGRPLLILKSVGQRSRLINTGNRNILSAQYLENPLLDRLQTWYTGTS
jgi:hypothetical protein